MKKYILRGMSLFVTLAMIFSLCAVGFTASAEDAILTQCGGKCDYCPSIVVPGLFQSQNRLYDENGNERLDGSGEPLTQLLVDISTKDILKYVAKVIMPLTLSLVLQADVGLSKTISAIAADALRNNKKGNDGKHIENVDVIRYPMSVAQCTEEGKSYIYSTVPLENYTKIAGEDHLYFFTYDSFGSISDIADELFAFIQKVKAETSHNKVNLVPISQGGSIANALMERYKDELCRDLNRMVMIIPALDGSYLIGKIFNSQFIKEDEMLYKNLFPMLMDADLAAAYAINLALRILPKNTAHNIIDRTVQAFVDSLLVNCTCMWALTPISEYEDLYAKYLTDGTREAVRTEVEFYHEAQKNSRDNLLYLQAHGVKIFDLVDYDYPFYPLFTGWDNYNADGIIQVDSTSAGATSSAIGSTLPEGYTQQNTYCTCGGNHISPDNKVDASTGILCENTFYFDEGNHEHTGDNDVLIGLAIALLTDENFTDIHSYPERYPQFNTARENKWLRRDVEKAKKIDTSQWDASDAQELAESIAQCETIFEKTVVIPGEMEEAANRLQAILIKTGHRAPAKTQSPTEQKLTEILFKLSDWAYKILGPRGFSDVIFFRHTKWK